MVLDTKPFGSSTTTKFLFVMVKPCQFSIRYSNKLRNSTIQKLARKSLLDLELMWLQQKMEIFNCDTTKALVRLNVNW